MPSKSRYRGAQNDPTHCCYGCPNLLAGENPDKVTGKGINASVLCATSAGAGKAGNVYIATARACAMGRTEALPEPLAA